MDYRLKKTLLKPFDLLYKINPELELKLLFRLKTGEKLDLENPKTYNEKLQWIKLYYKEKLIPKLVDKYSVREFVARRGLENILNEIYWYGFNPSEIPYEELPEKFVIKATHGSGFNLICNDKRQINPKKINSILEKWLNTDFIPAYGEWFYGIEKPRIIIEKYLEDVNGNIPEDYKIFCFDGEPKYIIVDTDRYSNHKRNIYDLEWNFYNDYTMGFPNDKPIQKPEQLDLMLEYARILSKGFPHVRVDLYALDSQIYFGEMTFTNGSGFDRIKPDKFDIELGNLIKLPNEN